MGQTDSSVLFVARGGDYTVFLTGEGAVLALRGAEPVRVRPTCAKTPIAVEGLEPTGGTSNYFRGSDASRWKTGIPNFRQVRYTGACAGVDVTYYGNPQKLEYDFLVAPGTNPDTVRVEYDGAKSLRIAPNGDLVLNTGAGDLVQPLPRVYQDIDGRRVAVEAGYRLAGDHGVKFALARYRRDLPLVIDPVLVYSSYIGGSGGDSGSAIAVDGSGNAYVAGQTFSVDFPLAGPVQAANGGGLDAFAMKISANGLTRIYATYLGGTDTDLGTSIAVDGVGNAYIGGNTSSANFPSTLGSFQTHLAGSSDGFIVKLNSTGSGLIYATFLGGTQAESLAGLAVDANGNAYVGGWTNSTNFPVKAGAFQSLKRGVFNAFVTKLSADGTSAVYSTLIGGTGSDLGAAIAVDGLGNAHIVGQTNSNDFPLTAGVFQAGRSGASDAFVTKLNASGSGLLYSTLLGGSGDDNAVGIRLDGTGNAYIAGNTSSLNFPAPNAAQATYGGGTSDAFVSKLNSTGTGLLFSTYLGGSGAETAAAIAIDSTGASYVTGQTASANFPSVNPLFSTGGTFVASVAPSGSPFVYSTHLTGDAGDSGSAIAVRGNSVYVTGHTTSAAFPVHNALQPAKAANANLSGFVTVLAPSPSGALRFVQATPCRIADTRNANGPFGGPSIAGGATRDFAIPTSVCGIPANALAYSLNMTVVPLGPLGFLSVWPKGQSRPLVSTLNSNDGRIKANAAIVPAGTNGAITVFASNPTHVVIDIDGYFVPASGTLNLAFYPITPCRLSDTRIGAGTFGGPALAAGATRAFPVLSGACGIPATAQAYATNMTVVPSGPLGFLTTWPAGSARPLVSTLNAPTGQVTSNAAIVPAGTAGAIDVFSTNATHLIIDITGYFAPPGAGSLDFFASTPCRITDTRDPVGTFGGPIMGANETRSFPIPTSACGIPATAKGYSLNATVVPPAPLGFLALWGTGAQPAVSTLNSSDGTIVANAAIVPAGTNGVVTAFTSNPSHLILDINGYFQ